jgi:hypothetical protein
VIGAPDRVQAEWLNPSVYRSLPQKRDRTCMQLRVKWCDAVVVVQHQPLYKFIAHSRL